MVNIDSIVGVWPGHVLVTVGNAVSISITWLSGSLAIGVVNVITIGTMIVRAGLVDKRVTTAISIAWLSISLAIITISISSGQTLSNLHIQERDPVGICECSWWHNHNLAQHQHLSYHSNLHNHILHIHILRIQRVPVEICKCSW